MQGTDNGAVVHADVDVVRLVHHCSGENQVAERGLEVRYLEEKAPDWGFEICGGGRGVLGDEVLEVIGVALGDGEDGELWGGVGEQVERASSYVWQGRASKWGCWWVCVVDGEVDETAFLGEVVVF